MCFVLSIGIHFIGICGETIAGCVTGGSPMRRTVAAAGPSRWSRNTNPPQRIGNTITECYEIQLFKSAKTTKKQTNNTFKKTNQQQPQILCVWNIFESHEKKLAHVSGRRSFAEKGDNSLFGLYRGVSGTILGSYSMMLLHHRGDTHDSRMR